MTISKIWNEATYFSYERGNDQWIDCPNRAKIHNGFPGTEVEMSYS